MKKNTNVVITGGPCAGKTTAMSYLKQNLEELGYFVLIVPEAATLCINGGIHPGDNRLRDNVAQSRIIHTAYQLEELFRNAAMHDLVDFERKVVTLHDRGIPDCSAYMSDDAYSDVIAGLGFTVHHSEIRDNRYDAVIHMRTAAMGAEEFYTLENNEARYETPEQAAIQDEKIVDAWTGSPHLRIVPNEKGKTFDHKIKRVFQEVCAVLGEPIPVEIERKFLVKFRQNEIPKGAQVIDIEQSYLHSIGQEELRVRKRGQNGVFGFYKTTKRSHPDSGARYEFEEMISEEEFNMALNFRNPNLAAIKKQRTCFVHNDKYFELDVFKNSGAIPFEWDGLLEIELTKGQEDSELKNFDLPFFITDVEEVTNEPHYYNRAIAERAKAC